MKKFVSTILIIAAISSIALIGFFYKMPQAKAILGIGDISIDIVNQVKDWVVDTLPRTIARHMMIRLQQEVARWAQGGFTDENKPFAMIDWKQELKDIANLSSARFIQEFELTPLCMPIKLSLGTALGLNMPYGVVPYEIYGACTLQNVVDNIEEFYKNPSIAVYGWDTWTALMQPQNNFLGSALMASGRKQEIQNEETQAQEKEIQAGGGIKNETICNETDLENCQNNCYAQYQQELDIQNCQKSCEKSSTGVCLQETTKKLGLEIKASVDKVIGSDVDWLISADEITEMIDLVFSGLFNKLTHGINGILTKATSTSVISQNQAQYGYYQDYKKTQTPEDLEKLRTDILENILRAIKNITTSAYDCNKDYQLKGDVYSEVAADILNEESQHLYVGVEGVDLKPDFEVLDNPNNSAPLYGVTWDDIPFAKYPNKCADIKGIKCIDIKNRLPYELKIGNINAECTTGCLAKINEYRKECQTNLTTCLTNCSSAEYIVRVGEDATKQIQQCKDICQATYNVCDSKTITQAVTDGKCSSYAVGKACLDGAILIDRTKNRCDECFSQAQAKCEAITDVNEKTLCLRQYCGNYEDITVTPSITGARDFYNRCQAVEFQNSCYVCLKEYFMPASYCEVIYDFINRSFVKYPALVYENMWWGMFNKFASCAENRTSGQQIFTGLVCRILPDFVFPGGGTCKSRCKATAAELKNTFDDEPNDSDCTPMKWTAGAYHPGSQYIPYLVNKKTKCCAALTSDPELYRRCRGITGQLQATCTYATPPEDEPQCYCAEGYRPLGFTRTGNPSRGGGTSMGGDCGDFTFTTLSGREIYGETNASPINGDTVYFGPEACKEGTSADVDTGIRMDPGPRSTDWEQKSNGSKIKYSFIGSGGSTHAGVYISGSNTTRDPNKSTGWTVCMKCDPNDPGYPSYGTDYDQCDSKTQ